MTYKIHIIGIGGIGMSGIAQILLHNNHYVQGSNNVSNEITENLEKKGIRVFIGHKANNVVDVNYVLISSAIQYDNIEIITSQKLGIPILKRGDIFSQITRSKYTISISGSHGKTTTTSMIGHLFDYYKKDPTIICGGIIKGKNNNISNGSSEYLILEGDESDGTFTKYFQDIGVITNIDKEHLDFHKDFDNLKNQFIKFIENTSFEGFVVICLDNVETEKLINLTSNRKTITYGIKNKKAHLLAYNIVSNNFTSRFDLQVNMPFSKKTMTIKDIKLNIPGEHNILNSLAALAIAIELDMDITKIPYIFEKFLGVKRRFCNLGEHKKILFLDDYAHHPEEIKVSLKTAKTLKNRSSLICIFQPHKFSRTHNLLNEFTHCFNDADKIFISEIFSASEENVYSISSNDIVTNIKNNNKEIYVEHFIYSPEYIQNIIKQHAQPNDVVIFMGAGDITKWSKTLINTYYASRL